MTSIKIKTAEVKALDIVEGRWDVRRDLHAFVRYVMEHDIKRTHRENMLPKPHALRLARMMTHGSAAEDIEKEGESAWLDFIDWLCLLLGFVKYETKGVLSGWSSGEPSFPDNFMTADERRYKAFVRKPLRTQEKKILETLLNDADYGNNEFFVPGPLGRLDEFDSFGCACGVMPTLRFPRARKRLLELLAQCRAGVWYSVDSLVDWLGKNDPFFLIPEAVPASAGKKAGDRYDNFKEYKMGRKEEWRREEIKITETSPAAFKRVEGRFVERFLENIPLAMGYVDVAYARGGGKTGGGRLSQSMAVTPSLGVLRAFRLTDRFLPAINGEIPEPEVTVLPNFEVHLDSAFYPAAAMADFLALADVVSEDVHTVFKLKKKKVAALSAKTDGDRPDAIAMLGELAVREPPPNVLAQIEEWMGHGRKVTFYEGFGLLEGVRQGAEAGRFVVERIMPGACIVHSPLKLFEQMEKALKVPLKIRHGDRALRRPPDWAQSLFPASAEARRPAGAGRRKKRRVLKRTMHVTLRFPDAGIFDAFSKALLDRKCVLPTDREALTITYEKKHEKTIGAALRDLDKKYNMRVEDI